MPQRPRAHLYLEFSAGERPDELDFRDLIDSGLNSTDDGVDVDTANDDSLVVPRGLALGDSNSTQAGTLRFRGGSLEVHDGAGYSAVGGGGGAFAPVGVGTSVAYSAGNVGIGTFAPEPTHALEVELGDNTGPDQRVAFGNLCCRNGQGPLAGSGVVSHVQATTNNNFALRQTSSGETTINSASGSAVRFQSNGTTTRMVILSDGNVVVGATSNIDTNGTPARFQVQGDAFKNGGAGGMDMWDTPSDGRLKTDVRELDAGLAEILKIRPVRYRFTGAQNTPKKGEYIGVIAQEIEKILPETVATGKPPKGEPKGDGLKTFNASALTYVLINAVKELTERVETLEAQLQDKG